MKVALVCHFSNAEIRQHLDLCRHCRKVADFAAWNSELIRGLERQDDVELYVLAPHFRMKHLSQCFKIGRTEYRFYKGDLPLVNRCWPPWFHVGALTGFRFARHYVQRWIDEIKPDIVNLVGAENPYYSASILGLKGYPVFVSMQSVYSNPARFKAGVRQVTWRSRYERAVIAENRYFGINAPFMPELIKRDVRDPELLWCRYPIKCETDEIRGPQNKDFDFVQFSGLTELKGASDTVRATALVKRHYPNVRVRMFGRITESYLSHLRALVNDLGLSENIFISHGFLHHADMMKEATRARCYILPTKLDTIPCTIFEATRLGLPVISYETGDIPLLNKGAERVLLSKTGDVSGLAANMKRILDEKRLGEKLLESSRAFIAKYFSNEADVAQFVSIYKAVINNYRNGTPIPKRLYYDGYLEMEGREDL